jgi:hypothetical protein
MINPFDGYNNREPKETITEIFATLEICTLYKGVPHGMALISYDDPESKLKSFRGLGMFNHGILHNTPFTLVGDGRFGI